MKPIWYFVGLILLIMGIIIFISGIYSLMNPPVNKTVLGELNPDIWWGLIMTAAGSVYFFANRRKSI
jgi:divalent metal cation (Fe/Co/Zn/Cd) transporter